MRFSESFTPSRGNAMFMGIDSIADLAHIMEDIFDALIRKELSLSGELMDGLFRATDKLGALIKSVQSGEKVSYLGIRTKLSIYLKNAKEGQLEEEKEGEDVEVEEDSDDSDGAVSGISFADVIQIPVKRMDEILNLVGELVIERDRLVSIYGAEGKSTLEFEGLKRISSNLHYGIMNARMVQMGFLF